MKTKTTRAMVKALKLKQIKAVGPLQTRVKRPRDERERLAKWIMAGPSDEVVAGSSRTVAYVVNASGLLPGQKLVCVAVTHAEVEACRKVLRYMTGETSIGKADIERLQGIARGVVEEWEARPWESQSPPREERGRGGRGRGRGRGKS